MSKLAKKAAPRIAVERRRTAELETGHRIDGIVIAKVVSAPVGGRVRIAPAGWPASRAKLEAGVEVAVAFEGGHPDRPIVIGALERFAGPEAKQSTPAAELPVTARLDGETVILEAAKEIVLRCGEATITLTRAGKILIQGAYVSSRSSGVNRIRGGAVQLN